MLSRPGEKTRQVLHIVLTLVLPGKRFTSGFLATGRDEILSILGNMYQQDTIKGFCVTQTGCDRHHQRHAYVLATDMTYFRFWRWFWAASASRKSQDVGKRCASCRVDLHLRRDAAAKLG
jgi:hypothetical protein